MELSVELQEPLNYSLIYTIIVLILLLMSVFAYMIKTKKTHHKDVTFAPSESIEEIKTSYISNMKSILDDYNSNRYDLRKSYQRASYMIREFASYVTGKNFSNLTLEELSNSDTLVLYDLIKKYYNEEFTIETKGELEVIIEKSCEVILSWN